MLIVCAMHSFAFVCCFSVPVSLCLRMSVIGYVCLCVCVVDVKICVLREEGGKRGFVKRIGW